VTVSVPCGPTGNTSASTVTEPGLTAVRSPREPAALETVAMVSPVEIQVTSLVILRVDLSSHVPVALSCWVAPTATLSGDGVTAIDSSFAPLTASNVDPDTPSKVAVIVVDPALMGVATPAVPPVGPTLATEESEDVQVQSAVTVSTEPSS